VSYLVVKEMHLFIHIYCNYRHLGQRKNLLMERCVTLYTSKLKLLSILGSI